MNEVKYYKREGWKTLATQCCNYVYIQTLTRTADGEGGFTQTWTTGDMIPAAISPIQARQQFENKSVGVDATHLIKIRGLISVDEKTDRFLFGTRIFEIVAIENIQERGIVKVITCKEVR